jgi:hypothetical protein
MEKKNLSKKDLSKLSSKVTDMSLRRAKQELDKDPKTGKEVLDHVLKDLK